MNNPWTQLAPRPPYVLPSELPVITTYNHRVSEIHQIHTNVLPEPFLGDPLAPIVLLNLNPGFSDRDPALHADPQFQELSLGNLMHQRAEYPFYLLDPRLADTPGANWWRARLKAPIQLVGVEGVANSICCVEYFPYHSLKYRDLGRILDSQRYSFRLVEQAIARHALIIVMRSRKLWFEQVPRLRMYDRLHVCTNPQRPYISRGNLPQAFPMIERILQQ